MIVSISESFQDKLRLVRENNPDEVEDTEISGQKLKIKRWLSKDKKATLDYKGRIVPENDC